MRPTIPTHLTDSQLIDELKRCARDERHASASLIAHLAEMDARELHLGLGFSSLFAYCLEVLHLSDSATCKRIDVARAARRHPALLDLLADGSLNLSTARVIAPHLTDENHQDLMGAATGLRKRAVEELVARRFPKPDVVTLIRKLPSARPPAAMAAHTPDANGTPASSDPSPDAMPTPVAVHAVHPAPPRPLATPLSADRYQIRFTASEATWKKLRAAQELLRHAVPSGDPAEIIDRALTALIEDLAKKKYGVVKTPATRERESALGSRHIPAKVRRAVWVRDQGHCAFVAKSGRRCQERGFLEFHHVEPHASGGPATVSNIQLRCRAHNAYESVLFYGPSKASGRGLSTRDSTGPGAGTAWGYKKREGSAMNLSRQPALQK